jgi:hypothetical protein
LTRGIAVTVMAIRIAAFFGFNAAFVALIAIPYLTLT